MDDMILSYHHYITIDEQSRITDGWSDGPAPDQDAADAILLTARGSYQFRLFPDGVENPALYDWEHMVPLYKWEDGQAAIRTQEEIETDIAAIPVPEVGPTAEERIQALEENKANQTDVDELTEALELILSGVTE